MECVNRTVDGLVESGVCHRQYPDPTNLEPGGPMTESPAGASTATLHTNHGDIVINLFADHAPKTVSNFVGLASGTKEYRDPETGAGTTGRFYDGLIFH